MPELDVPLDRIRFGQTSRKDAWWVHPLIWSIFFLLGFGYLGIMIFWPTHYWAEPYLTPLASPLFYGEGPHAIFGPDKPSWWPRGLPLIPGVFIALFPAGFRLTCYYYRGAYYKALWIDPPDCAVGEPRHDYRGEAKSPLVIMNIHRYFLYFGIALVVFLTYDVDAGDAVPGDAGLDRDHASASAWARSSWPSTSCSWPSTPSPATPSATWWAACSTSSRARPCARRPGTASPASTGGTGVWAWFSLYTMCSTDLYIRLCAAGIITDWRII